MCTCSHTHLSPPHGSVASQGCTTHVAGPCSTKDVPQPSNPDVLKLDDVWWKHFHSYGLLSLSEDSTELSGGVCSFLWETEEVGGVEWNHWRPACLLMLGVVLKPTSVQEESPCLVQCKFVCLTTQWGQTNQNGGVCRRGRFIAGLSKEKGWLMLRKPQSPQRVSAKHL